MLLEELKWRSLLPFRPGQLSAGHLATWTGGNEHSLLGCEAQQNDFLWFNTTSFYVSSSNAGLIQRRLDMSHGVPSPEITGLRKSFIQIIECKTLHSFVSKMCRIVRQFSASKDSKCFKKWVKLHLTSETINLPRRQTPSLKIIKASQHPPLCLCAQFHPLCMWWWPREGEHVWDGKGSMTKSFPGGFFFLKIYL